VKIQILPFDEDMCILIDEALSVFYGYLICCFTESY